MGSPRGTHACSNYVKGGGADVGSQVDMSGCADACTHYNQGVGTDGPWLGYADGATPGCTGLGAEHDCIIFSIQLIFQFENLNISL